MFTQISIRFQGHTILYEGGEHNTIIEHLKAMTLIALDVTINVKVNTFEKYGFDFNSIPEAIKFIERAYYVLSFKEEK